MKMSLITDQSDNVLYLGIDNPITVNCTYDLNIGDLSISNGSIIKSSGKNKFIVKVNKIGNSEIIISKAGITEIFKFSVKEMSLPSFYIGSISGGGMPANIFKAQMGCRVADSSNTKMKFEILGADVTFSGANFENPEKVILVKNNFSSIRDQISKCRPGTNVLFENIKVIGPANKELVLKSVLFTLN